MDLDEQPSTSDEMVEQFEWILLNMPELILLKTLERPMVLKKLKPVFLKILEQPMMLKNSEVQPMIISTVHQVVKKESQKLLPGGTRNDVPKERILHLKFLDDVFGPVLTSKELIRGVKGYPLQVALLDETEQIVTCGDESSAKVEIVLTDASGKDGEHNTNHGNLERRIIIPGDKEKPHFAKNVYISLEEGKGNLIDVKLGQDSNWTKNSKCSLGVRLVQKFRGITVQEAWTAPFQVKDNRGELNKNHDRPSLCSEVWRLKQIGLRGKPRKRLEEEKIKTVQDFLFWLSVNPEGLKKIIGGGDNKWKTIVEHAQDCNIDDKRIFFHKSSTEPQMGVIYDAVGELKGVIGKSNFVPIDDLSADKKDHAQKLLSSVLKQPAFVERYKTFFDDEASLLQRYPYKSSDINASTNSSIQQSSNGNDKEPGSSSRSTGPICIDDYEIYDMGPFPASEYADGDIPTDLGTLGQNAGTSEAVGEWSRTRSFHRLSSWNFLFEHTSGLSYDDLWRGMYDAMPDHNRIRSPTSPNPMIPHAGCMDYSNNIQTYSHTNELNAAPVEPRDVNTSNQPKRWKRLFCVVTWYSISKRVLDVTPKQKRQKVG